MFRPIPVPPPTVPVQPIVEENKDLLWSILTASGIYKNYVFAGSVTEFREPTNPTSVLFGLPFDGTNTGVNPDLRLMQFSIGDNINGPVSLLGPTRIKTTNNILIYSVEWEITPFIDAPVTIGFYTANYLNNEQGPQRALIIGSEGPSIFTTTAADKYKGSFFCTEVDDIFVVVDSNVAVTLTITAVAPDSVTYPKLELFKPVAYRLPVSDDDEDGNECGHKKRKAIAFATEELVDSVQQQVYLKPTKDFRDLTAEMVNYLNATLVTIILTPNPPTGTGSLPATQLYPSLETQFSANSISNNVVLPFDTLPTGTSWQVETNPNLSRGINVVVAESNPDIYLDPFQAKVSFTLNVTAPGIVQGETSVEYQPAVELGISHNNFIPYPVFVGDNITLPTILSGESATFSGLFNTLAEGVCTFGIRVTFTSGINTNITAANMPAVTVKDLSVTYIKIPQTPPPTL